MGADWGLGAGATRRIARTLDELYQGRAPILWLQGRSCSRCSVSLLHSQAAGPGELLTRYIGLSFQNMLCSGTGDLALELVNDLISQGDYLLVVEGACHPGDQRFGEQLARAARNAKAVLAVGTCAAFGGGPAAEGNLLGAASVPEYLANAGIQRPIIRMPGCPVNPEWLVGTIVHSLKFGLPALDAKGRPLAYFPNCIDDECPSPLQRQTFVERVARRFPAAGKAVAGQS